jgi:iron complex outermembrane receptor protein
MEGNSHRTGEAAGFYRRPNQSRSYTGLYPNGFLPEIHSTINDISAAAGFRGTGNWNFDLSNTFGKTVLIMVLKIRQFFHEKTLQLL